MRYPLHFLSARYLAAGLLALTGLAGCYEREHEKPQPPQWHMEAWGSDPSLSPRDVVINDVVKLILDYHFTEAEARTHPEYFDQGHGSYRNSRGRRYTILRPRKAWRAELNRLRDSLLATGPVDFRDTLRTHKEIGPHGEGLPGYPNLPVFPAK